VLEAYWPSRTTLHRMSLDYIRSLLDYLGNPQERLRIIHIAGTSGKTSTAYYAAALLTAAGKKAGLTVSPHVDLLNERVQINMTPLPEALFVREMNEFMACVEQGGFTPTYFELLYAFAFWEFARQQVEYAVIETGVGGLLDNTNVVTRSDKVCVLTDIGFDHTSLLGTTLPEIARQKAGIIQLHNAVFCWRQSAEVLAVFRAVTRQKQADLHILDAAQLGRNLSEGVPPSFTLNSNEILEALQEPLQSIVSAVKQALCRRAARHIGVRPPEPPVESRSHVHGSRLGRSATCAASGLPSTCRSLPTSGCSVSCWRSRSSCSGWRATCSPAARAAR